MDRVNPRCAGLDVHKDSVWACVRIDGRESAERFGTASRELLRLGDWLAGLGVTAVAMGSTGVYWEPVWNLLEGRFGLMLVNARHVKQVPGRKTDVKDCQWVARLLEHGLLRASFVPGRPQRELRALTRQRTQLLGDRTRVVNRIQKTLEDADIKLASAATDVTGKSGRAILGGQQRVGGQARKRPHPQGRWLKGAPTHAAWGASRTRRSYYSARHRRPAARRGKKRATIAVAHSLLVTPHCLLSDSAKPYADLGAGYFDRAQTPDRQAERMVRKLPKLGYTVQLDRPAA